MGPRGCRGRPPSSSSWEEGVGSILFHPHPGKIQHDYTIYGGTPPTVQRKQSPEAMPEACSDARVSGGRPYGGDGCTRSRGWRFEGPMGVWLGSALWCQRGGGILVLPGDLVLCHDWQWPVDVPFSCFAVGWLFAPCCRGGLQVRPHRWLYRCWTEVPSSVRLLVCGV